MMIIPRSLAMSLLIAVPKFDVTADDILQSRHRSGNHVTITMRLMQNVRTIFLLLDRPICE